MLDLLGSICCGCLLHSAIIPALSLSRVLAVQEAAATSPMAAGAAEVGAAAAELHAMCGLLVMAVCDDWNLPGDF